MSERSRVPALCKELRFVLRSVEELSESFDHPSLRGALPHLTSALSLLGAVPLDVPRRGYLEEGETRPERIVRDPDRDPHFYRGDDDDDREG